MLKVLEEPPTYALVVLTIDTVSNVLPTVVSRCKKVFATHVAPININSEEVADFLHLLSSNLGARLDWVAKNKNLKDKAYARSLLDTWQMVLRDFLLYSNGVENLSILTAKDIKNNALKPEDIRTSLDYLSSIREMVLSSNVNSTLAIESFLVNLC